MQWSTRLLLLLLHPPPLFHHSQQQHDGFSRLFTNTHVKIPRSFNDMNSIWWLVLHFIFCYLFVCGSLRLLHVRTRRHESVANFMMRASWLRWRTSHTFGRSYVVYIFLRQIFGFYFFVGNEDLTRTFLLGRCFSSDRCRPLENQCSFSSPFAIHRR